MLELRCPNCHNLMGRVERGEFVIRWRGRAYRVALWGIRSCECDQCGHMFTLERLAPDLIDETTPEACPA